MQDKNNSKRPKSGKYLQLRPITGRPKTAIHNTNKNNLQNNILDKKLITESEKENKKETENLNYQTSEKDNFLKIIGEESNKGIFDRILSNEVKRMKKINEKKNKLKEINLIEQNYDDLYEWTNLFNNSRPISSYTTLKKTKLNIKEDQKIEEFKSPVVLVDLLEDQMNLYFSKNNNYLQSEDNKKKIKNKLLNNKQKYKNPKKLNININSTNNNKISKRNISESHRSSIMINNTQIQNNNLSTKNINNNHIRPMSVYSPRLNTCSFYFSSAFSDYYNEDLKTFSEKMKILKAKVKSNPNKLNHTIKTQRKISSKKENKLNRLLNIEQFNFGKDNLVIAAGRKNPIPLLQSIFKQEHPFKEVIKENIKKYFNTMKPLGESNGQVDYTKNERWKLSKFLEEMRENKKDLNLKNNKNLNNYKTNNSKRNNLILSYYNKNDPYIKIFEKMAKTNNIKNNIIIENENNNNKQNFNPILQNINDNTFTLSFNKKFFEEKINIKEKNQIKNENEEKNKNVEINKDKKNNCIRPKTCYKSVGPTNHEKIIARPMTSKINKYNIYYTNFNEEQDKRRRNSFIENYLDTNSNLEYISSNCFPLKTISNVGNVSYDKINQMLQERKYKNDYFLTNIEQAKNNINNKKYKEEKIIMDKNNNMKNYVLTESNKWNENINKNKFNKKNKINFYNFENISSNLIKHKKKRDNFYTMKYFKKIGGKFYSSSNNVNVKNKRNNKRKILNNFYSVSKYSRDEQEKEIDFIDEAVSSQTNSSYQKINL